VVEEQSFGIVVAQATSVRESQKNPWRNLRPANRGRSGRGRLQSFRRISSAMDSCSDGGKNPSRKPATTSPGYLACGAELCTVCDCQVVIRHP